jgi:hypothetical protein
MAKKSTQALNWLQSTAVGVTRVHFLYAAAYMASIVVFDSWNLLTHPAVAQRWTAVGILLVINTIFWYISRIKFSSDTVYIVLILLLIAADIVFASLNVYWERGLASKAVVLFSVPIVTAAALRSRSTLLATAALSGAAYSIAIVCYFNLHYGESFRVELYGYLGLFCALFFILASLLLIVIQPKDNF